MVVSKSEPKQKQKKGSDEGTTRDDGGCGTVRRGKKDRVACLLATREYFFHFFSSVMITMESDDHGGMYT